MNGQRPIAELLQDRQALSREISDLNRKLEGLDTELFERLESVLSAFGVVSNSNPVPKTYVSSVVSRHRLNKAAFASAQLDMPMPKAPKPASDSIGGTLTSLALSFLYEAQRPLTTSEIYERLQQKGIQVPGTNPKNNLSAHLSRSSLFSREGSGWWLAEKQEPPEGGS